MNFKLNRFFHYLYALGLFILLNVPSIKLFYSSPIINMGAFFILWVIGMLRTVYLRGAKIKFGKSRRIFLSFFMAMWSVILLVSFLNQSLTIGDFVRYVIVVLVVSAVMIFTETADIPRVIFLQISWSLFLSVYQMTNGISFDQNLGQHYLTAGVPIASGIVCALGLFTYKMSAKKTKLTLLASALVMVYAITTLSGRSPILLSVGVVILIFIVNLMMEKSIIKKVKTAILSVVFIPAFFYVLIQNLSPAWIDRFLRMGDLTNEPRYFIYQNYAGLMQDNVIGYGIGGYGEGGYPHNIFIEVWMGAGLVGFLLLLAITIMFVFKVIKSIQIKSYSVTIGSLALYLFLTWNLSFDLSSSYMPFAAIAMTIIATEKTSISYFEHMDKNLKLVNREGNKRKKLRKKYKLVWR